MPQIFPERLKKGISSLENDIKNIEAKVQSLKLECERRETKLTRPTKRFEKPPTKVLSKRAVTQNSSVCKCSCCVKTEKVCCGCTGKPAKKTKDMDICYGSEKKITAKLVGRNHVHEKIRIPTGKTWEELLTKDKKDQRSTRSATEKKSRGLSILQKAVEDAQVAKEKAERRAALQALALDKMKMLLEVKDATEQMKRNTIADARRSLEELLAAERHNASMMQIEAALQEIHNGEPSESEYEPRLNNSAGSSRPFRHSSPTSSKRSVADFPEDWHDISDIQQDSFSTF